MEAEPELRLPNGRELTAYKIFNFCFDLSETDLIILQKLLDKEMSINELSKELGMSRTIIWIHLNNLSKIGILAKTIKHDAKKVGRPNYFFKIDKEVFLEQVVKNGIGECADAIVRYAARFSSKNKENPQAQLQNE